MRSYRIVKGALRNTSKPDRVVSIESGVENAHISSVPLDAVIRVTAPSSEGGFYQECSITLRELVDRALGL